jgi:hypothetical protein
MLATDGTFLALLHPAEDAVGVKLVLAVQHVLFGIWLHIGETDRTLEDFLIHNWYFSVLLPDGVDDVSISSADRATVRAATYHPHDETATITILALHLFLLQVLIKGFPLRFRQRIV